MIWFLRFATRAAELALWPVLKAARLFFGSIAFNRQLGPLRHLATATVVFVTAAVLLVYVVAPIRGVVGGAYLGAKLRYDAERWLATSIHDTSGNFLGTFDARLDSAGDVNTTGLPIEFGDYTANPDHKSIPVLEVPPHYWNCLVFHEDRHLGTWLNPFGIDLLGVLKIPYSTLARSIARRRPSLGVGGSTLPMQLARVIYKTPPSASESAGTKLARKLSEWWIAPVIYAELTRGGDNIALKQWAANHLWLAQRTGGQSLHGVELAAQIVFGRDAKDLTTAQQFVLASAVNKPIILLEGSERLNEVRMSRWKYIAEVRAKACAARLLKDPQERMNVLAELVHLAGGPPDPQTPAALHKALDRNVRPDQVARAAANPIIRANLLLPAARFGLIEELKQAFGRDWRNHVRTLTTTIDAGDNVAFNHAIKERLTALDAEWSSRLEPGFTLDPAKVGAERRLPHVAVVAANARGQIVRYFDSSEQAPYFGSVGARSDDGRYERDREPRAIASTGKMIAAMAIANQSRDTPQSLVLDTDAPERGLETCRKGGGLRRGRTLEVAFACSLNRPLEARLADLGQASTAKLIAQLRFNMPPAPSTELATPPSTAAVRGLIAGSPQQVHHMAAVTLAALTGRPTRPVVMPSLIAAADFRSPQAATAFAASRPPPIVPATIIKPGAAALLRSVLSAPLCYRSNGQSHGTLKSLSEWCAARRKGLKLHIAKTGTSVTEDPNATVDVWAAGGLQFDNGRAYSYVVVIGTGSAREPFARNLHSSQIAAPLVETLLLDLEATARRHPTPPPRTAEAADEREGEGDDDERGIRRTPGRPKPIRTAEPFSIRSFIENQIMTSR